MKVWHISDTHSYHDLLQVPENVDLVIHSGDATNYYEPRKNYDELVSFINWFKELPIDDKIYVGGNHDSAIFKNHLNCLKLFKDNGIHYLENSFIDIDGIKIWGSPHSPTFGNWYFMKSRHKLAEVWSHIPQDTDIIVTHTPPKGILDYSFTRENYVERCGCKSLLNKIKDINPKLSLFGHIHNCKDIINAGEMKLSTMDTIFSNGSVVTDGKFGSLSSNGNILII